jgi:hypothetical protein
MADFNIFGAKPSSNLEELYKMGLLGNQNDSSNFQDFTRKANRQSNIQGLLTGALSYLAQPKNQNFGSALPYLARAGLQGVQAAGSSMDRYEQDAMQKLKFQEQQRILGQQKADEELKIQLLNDPRVQADPILRAAVESNPEKVYEILNTPKKPLSQSERLAQLMTMDANPNETLTNTQKAEMNAIKQILSVGSPTGQTFGGVNLPTAPEGYYYDKNPDGTLKTNEEGNPYVVPVAGSAEDIKRKKEDKKEKVGKESKATIAATVIVDAQRALDLIDLDSSTTGADAFALRLAPGTKAFALDQMVKSIQANIGIDKLLDIKASGAGLGQVPQSQLEMLASVLGQLNTAQDKETVRYNVERVLTLYSDIVRQAGGEEALANAITQSLQTPERKKLESKPKTKTQEEEDLLNKYS